MAGTGKFPAGVEGTPLQRVYNIWAKMHDRCRNPRSDGYANYGARGIVVWSGWARFRPFGEWAMANGYAAHLTLDRRDNDGPYSPDNCQWATRRAQNQNQRQTRRLADGRPAITLAQQHGVPPSTFSWRIANGWPMELAATAPPHTRLRSHDEGKVRTKETAR